MAFFDTKIEFLKGVGPQKADLLKTELSIFTFGDLIQHFPFRHEDRTKFYSISEIHENLPYVQLKGRIVNVSTVGERRKKRLVARFDDGSGAVDLVWFQGIPWISKKLKPGYEYIAFGKPQRFGRTMSISHPELEEVTIETEQKGGLEPVYSTTEKLKNKFLDSRGISKLIKNLLPEAVKHITESLPEEIISRYGFIARDQAINNLHYPSDAKILARAVARLKFEELFLIQLQLLSLKLLRVEKFRGQVFDKVPTLTDFYKNHLPFDLTNAQKRVVKEIYSDFKSGKQMNRLLQGDVGSGKTIVAFICMLIAIDNDAQACLMAPTEILADQHYNGLKEFADKLGITIAKLTGSSKKSERKVIHEDLLSGNLKIIVGTHALIEDTVDFKNLGLCIIDEQHRFGVAQRAKLWQKQSEAFPHILVMTATPIPRTLAMTLYGDLDVSQIDELPAGRKPIQTSHLFDSNRLRLFGFIKEQIEQGRQTYIVYPLIEESEKLDYKNLEDGYESVCRAFPDFHISIVHGKMKAADKDFEMQRFVKGETQIMVATTVIEVGVNVPNATVMVIENAEKFGLAQLHQLRGRVGRGGEQSYCILMTSYKLSKEGKIRIKTMTDTNNGFEIADVDLKLRGPGDISGTQQSGVVNLKFADIARDGKVIKEARALAREILEEDPTLSSDKNSLLKVQLDKINKAPTNWSRIS
ncbi:ATP-dependent DNA helicase RecG [Chondrinema litorale]|uniref:ATP-dependent DNA helicase RecG n=1 Tax=Chondrinema litorale TaxID=2994555 RepID=UPI0025441607|nr:ATP-dependent DNA helicase RecG [Chondrinema litorale]UZR94248.1 ATP-dependent DNA helicase RecG [Chondrinema litorale]